MDRQRLTIQLIVLFIIVLSLRFFYFDKWILNDASVFGVIGRGLGDGKVLYRDFWDHKPPVIYLIFLSANKIFGNKFTAISFFEIPYLWVISSCFLIIARKKFSSVVSFFGAIIFCAYISSLPTSGTAGMIETYLLGPSLLFLYFITSGIEVRGRTFFYLGVAGAVSLLTKQTALASVTTLALFLLANFRRAFIKRIGLAALGMASVAAVMIIYLINFGIWRDFYSQIIDFNRYYVGQDNFYYKNIYSLITQLFIIRYPLLILLGVLAIIKLKLDRRALFLYLWIALELIQIILAGHLYNHYLINMLVPISYLILFVLEDAERRFPKRVFMIAWCFCLIIFSPLIQTQSILALKYKIENKYTRMSEMLIKAGYQEGQVVLDFNDWPHVNYFLNAKTVGKFIYPVPLETDSYLKKNEINEYISEIFDQNPDFIIINNNDNLKKSGTLAYINQDLIKLVNQKYWLVGQTDNNFIYKRN